ncbi:EAL domain-containing protein [Lichenihabitans psoromatis]|uniref:EAL domain-containing protein n=1 Tax=Lichenihabitans psoromatis TaxID=2528642 RepID=UPI0013F15CC3|nr:EAL domain-containing protein [Lichenihabitans psoromatis]
MTNCAETTIDIERGVALLRTCFDQTRQGFLLLDQNRNILAFNEHFQTLVGYPQDVLHVGTASLALIDSAFELGYYPGLTIDEARSGWETRFISPFATEHQRTTASGKTLSLSCIPTEQNGWYIITCRDISEELNTQRALVAQNDRFDAALSNSPHGLCMFDEHNRLILCNPAYRKLYNLPEDLLRPGTALQDILAYRATINSGPRSLQTYFDVTMAAQTRGEAASTRVELQDGRTIRITHNPMPHGGYVASHEDVTAAMGSEARIRYLANHDSLTGLPNRIALRERLEDAMGDVRRGEKLAVLYLDLDAFKTVNDTLGHPVGDRVLIEVTTRLKRCLRDVDFVSRIGGDEFIVLQFGSSTAEQATVLALRLIDAVSNPYDIDGHQIVIGVCIGVAFCPAHGLTSEAVIKNADLALYRAKSGGRNTFRLFEHAMDIPVQLRRQFEIDLRAGIANEAFELYYQPLIEIETGVIKSFEALIRWKHPERGLLSPIDFIPLAEESGLIVPLGEWIIRRACLDAAAWPAEIGVAVNLSPVQFKAGNLLRVVRAALADSGLPPTRLEVEITESVLLVDNEVTAALLHEFHNVGIRIALDDFGTGYSSLSYLRSFPFDKIKIDKSFIRELGERQDCAAIVKAIADLGLALGMVITAEGVETAEQLSLVRRQGCGEAQGYLFNRPRPIADMPAMLRMDGSWRDGVS